ncbi:MAG: enolase C-terminal domain-like protein [Thermodesulfobacteriota bacterium]|nr:enolase C-terminal domain-like protein [Thermodesulfobacteriota bacterium]
MRIDKINIYKVSLTFAGDFSHSRKEGLSANSIIVEITTDQNGIKGYGESAPRLYVTGESNESVVQSVSFFIQKANFPWELNDVLQIWDFIDSLPNGKENNAAICALELSLLDALGKGMNVPVIEYLPKKFIADKVYYGAAIPLSNNQRIKELCKLIRTIKINKLRIKMGKDFAKNKDAVLTVKRIFGDDCNLRIDVNGTWDLELALDHVPLLKDFKIKVVEQPMRSDDPCIADFARVMHNNGVILMADESACSLQDVERIANEGYYNMINIRLSKCGGFRRSLKIINYLRSKGIPFQIGCQLGESGILSAAGRALCLLCQDAVYYDGSYDKFLLKENITSEHVSFGLGGEAGPLDGPGLGVEVNRKSLDRLSDSDPITILRP